MAMDIMRVALAHSKIVMPPVWRFWGRMQTHARRAQLRSGQQVQTGRHLLALFVATCLLSHKKDQLWGHELGSEYKGL